MNPFPFSAPPAVVASPQQHRPGHVNPYAFTPHLIYWPYPSPPISPSSYFNGIQQPMQNGGVVANMASPTSPLPQSPPNMVRKHILSMLSESYNFAPCLQQLSPPENGVVPLRGTESRPTETFNGGEKESHENGGQPPPVKQYVEVYQM